MSSIPHSTIIEAEKTCSLKQLDDDSDDFVISDSISNEKLSIKKNPKSIENISCGKDNNLDNKDDPKISIKIINLLNHLQKIIKEDNQRFEIFEKKKGRTTDSLNQLTSIIEDYDTNILPEELDIATDKLKQNIINKFQLYYSNLRDMDLRIMKLENEKNSLEESIKSKNVKIEKLGKSKIESFDNRDKFKSLGLETNKRNEIELCHLREESKIFEQNIEDLMKERKILKKENQVLKHNNNELKNEQLEIQTTYEKKNAKLTKQCENLKSEMSKYENTESEKDELIRKFKAELKAKENIFTTQIEQSQNASLPTDIDEIERLNEEINSLRKQLMSEKQNSEEKIVKMKSKYDEECEEQKNQFDLLQQKYNSVEESNVELNDRIQRLSNEQETNAAKIKKNEESMAVMRGKIKDLNSKHKELDEVRLIKQQLAAKESENEKLVNEKFELDENFEKTKLDFELLKKRSRAQDMEIHNLKLMMSKNKNTEK